MSYQEKAPGQTLDVLKKLGLSAGLETPWCELEEVLRLLPT